MKPTLRVVKPDEAVTPADGPLVYRYGKFSNLVAAQRGDRPRPVTPGAALPDRWRQKSGAELAMEGPGLAAVDLELMDEGLDEYYAAGELLDELRPVGEVQRGTVERSLFEQIERGELPRRRR
ncbi:MAG: hypothetical protein AB7N24_23310 [Dehalococcoidia bacterium]